MLARVEAFILIVPGPLPTLPSIITEPKVEVAGLQLVLPVSLLPGAP